MRGGKGGRNYRFIALNLFNVSPVYMDMMRESKKGLTKEGSSVISFRVKNDVKREFWKLSNDLGISPQELLRILVFNASLYRVKGICPHRNLIARLFGFETGDLHEPLSQSRNEGERRKESVVSLNAPGPLRPEDFHEKDRYTCPNCLTVVFVDPEDLSDVICPECGWVIEPSWRRRLKKYEKDLQNRL